MSVPVSLLRTVCVTTHTCVCVCVCVCVYRGRSRHSGVHGVQAVSSLLAMAPRAPPRWPRHSPRSEETRGSARKSDRSSFRCGCTEFRLSAELWRLLEEPDLEWAEEGAAGALTGGRSRGSNRRVTVTTSGHCSALFRAGTLGCTFQMATGGDRTLPHLHPGDEVILSHKDLPSTPACAQRWSVWPTTISTWLRRTAGSSARYDDVASDKRHRTSARSRGLVRRRWLQRPHGAA